MGRPLPPAVRDRCPDCNREVAYLPFGRYCLWCRRYPWSLYRRLRKMVAAAMQLGMAHHAGVNNAQVVSEL